jgi:ABC-type Fe3+-citrate transport system substrate-binding protein
MENTQGKKLIVNCETGEITYDDYSAEEIAEQLAKGEEVKKQIEEHQAKIAAKASAEAKLATLGLTAEDLKALGL